MLTKNQPFKVNISKINQTTRNRSLVDHSGEQILQLSQNQVNFVNTELGELYEISLSVRNVSQHSQKIKVRKPQSGLLSVHTSKEGSLASGLDLKLTVVFDSKQNQPITDKVFIMTDSFEIQIPINVYPQVGKLEFEPFLNFGFGKAGTILQSQWEITNKAETSTHIKLIPLIADNSAKLTISTDEITIGAGEKRVIYLSLQSAVNGTVEGSIEIEPKTLGYSTLQFVANYCEFTRIISDSFGKELSEITLQPMFAGESTKVSAFLVNNTPQGCEFRITRKKGATGEQAVSLMTPEQIGRDDSEKLVQFSPSQGELQAYSSVQLKAEINAKYEESDLQLFCNYILGKQTGLAFEKEWTYALKTYLNHEDHHLDLQIKGQSMIPKIGVTPTFINFPQCSVQQKIRKSLKIQNFSTKSIAVQFQNSANYSFTPSKLKLKPSTSIKVDVTFSPKIIGDLNEICCLNIGVFSFPLKFFGKSVFTTSKVDACDTQAEQVPVEALENSAIQQQVSAIQKGRISPLATVGMDNSKNSIHFDTYRQNHQFSVQTNTPTDKSFNQDPYKRTRILRSKNGKQIKLDLNHLNPNQIVDLYPSTTKSQQQERLVSRQLTSHQLRNISVGPVIIDVGTIFLRSVQRKTFHICNFNPRPIAVRLQVNHQSFAQTSEERQILPGQSHGGFSIVFEALVQGSFKYTLQYILNGNHFFELMITGNCILPTLTLSRNDIKFAVVQQDKKFQKKQTVKLQNNYDYDVEYEWKAVTNSQFAIEPTFGIIKANSFVNTGVTYNFQNLTEIGAKVQQTLKLKIKHGKILQLKCSAFIPQSSCVTKTQQIQFKQIAIGKSYQAKVLFKNQSKNATIFKVNIPKQLQTILTATPKTGSVAGEQMGEVIFKITSSKIMQLQSLIQIIVRGSKPIQLPIRANIILPSVKIQNDQVDFGCTPIDGNASVKEVTLVNQSSISVDLQLRLHNDTFLAKSLKLGKITDDNITIVETKQLKTYKVTCLRVNPKCKCTLPLQFTPQATEDYQFYLPLFIPNTEPMDELQKICKCKGIKNKLMASQKQVNFGKIVIEQPEQIYSKSQTVQIRNPQDDAITWWVDETALAPFRLDKNKGRLEGFEKITLKIFFSAQTPGDYLREIQFYIDQADVDISRCYLSIPVMASACFPTLYFDQPYVILPVVRVGEQSSTVLEITNGGYENINLKHSVVQQFSNIDLKVKYLNGSNLGVTKKQIKVEVSFVSQKPVSFTIKLNFYDSSNRCFSINVSGTADAHTYTLVEQEKTCSNFGISIQKSCQFLKHYINSTGHLAEQIYEFPRSLVENQFQKFNTFLSNYSNVFQKAKNNVKKNCRTFFSFEYISEVIKILKSEGAFLNHIRPQMLLTFEQYNENIKIRAQQNAAVLSNFRKKDKNIFQIEQKHSWLVLFYQIFKVFSRLNPGKMKSGSEFWMKFTAREKILISWLQKTYLSEANIQLQTKGNEVLSTLNNGQLFSALISKYTNIKILDCYGKGVKGLKQKERRCKNVIDTFTQIGINCLFRLEDLLRSNEKEMLLILQNLYLILPSYLQKGEPIVFACQFGQVVTKSIQITNPSKYPITYLAKIQGSKAYSIDSQNQFVIDTKKTCQVKIKYISNVNVNNSPATLTLTGKADNKFTPSTFIFLLKSNNLGRISQKNVQVTGNLYEQLDFTVKVTNNFGQDGQFKIEMINSSKNGYNGFYLLNSIVRIKKGETAQVSMVFLPFTCDNQQIFLIFRDQKVGEFQYEVNGVVQTNIMCQEVLRITQMLYTNKKYQIELTIPTRNDLIVKARKAAEYLADRLQKRSGTQKDQKTTAINYQKYYPKLTTNEVYSTRLTTPNNSIILKNQQITIKDIDSNDDPSKRQDQKLLFQINLKSPIKQGSFTINMRNANNTDIRRYKITLNAISRPLKYQLQIQTPINKQLSQPLPLINVTNERNTYLVALLPSNEASKAAFSIDCEREVVVQAKEQNLVALTFKPKQLSSFSAVLKMQNLTTGQNIQYDVTGIAEQPQAETLVLQQQVRKEKAYSIKLPFGKNTKCNVQTFTLQNAQYVKSFVTTAQNSVFKFRWTPKISGKYEAKLIIEGDQTLLAYKLVVNVKNIIEGELKLRTVERKEVTGEIVLPQGKYSVINENINVKCDKELNITQNNTAAVISYYSSKPEEKQTMITFINDQLGQITYLIKVIVEPMPEIKLEPFKVQLGKMHTQPLTFQNTDETPMLITVKCSHPLLFFVQSQLLKVPPRSQITTHIIYKASSLQIQEGKIYFLSDKNAKWTYHLSGYGLAQSKPELKEMTVRMGQQICQSITFANPLNKTMPFTVTLQNIGEDQTFSTILKSSKVDLAYNQQLQIPITVSPKSVTLSKAILKIFINEKVCWKYELRARTIYRCSDEPRSYKFSTRTKNQQLIQFSLPQAKEYNGQNVKLNIIGLQNSEALLRNIVKPMNNGEATVNGEKVVVSVGILSYKPKNVQTLFQICADNGCKWIYKCDFVFLPPAIDDKFDIEAAINKPASVKFKLTNRLKSYSKFHAYFTSDSCIDFTVYPKSGQLQPYGRDGTPIEVVFCPTQYKKNWSGKLVIETEDSYWSYEVRGVLPIYNPPVGKSSLKQ